MELIQIQAFVSLAGTLHMPTSALELNTTQSHISKLIASLEAELGVRLFDRVGRGIILNEHGKMFYEYAAGALRMVSDGQSAIRSVRKAVLGTVKIGAYAFASVLHPCVKAFAAQNPNVNFYFSHVWQQSFHVLIDLTDIVITGADEGTNVLHDFFPVHRELLKEDFYIFISPKLVQYPKDKKSITLAEISKFPMIEVGYSPHYKNCVIWQEDLDRMRSIAGIALRTGYTADCFISKVSLLEQGLGFAIFPEICIDYVKRFIPDVQMFSIEDYPITRRLLVARKDRLRMSSAALTFWDFMLDYYRLEPDSDK